MDVSSANDVTYGAASRTSHAGRLWGRGTPNASAMAVKTSRHVAGRSSMPRRC
jgi:hypothetical protein